jgi:thiol-disulfide isomerase/thioredoxin
MKRYWTLSKLGCLFLIVAIKATAQTNIQLILKSAAPVSEINVMDITQQSIKSSIYQDTVNFSFNEISFKEKYTINCHVNDKIRWTQIWLDTGNVSVFAHVDSSKLIIDTVVNAPFYYEEKVMRNELKKLRDTHDTIGMNRFLLRNIADNVNNPFSLELSAMYITINSNYIHSLQSLKEILAKQGEQFKWHTLYGFVEKLYSLLANDRINMGDFNFINISGKETKVALKNAQFYILDFWFLGCAPCRRDHIVVKQKLELLKQRQIEIIGISTDDYNEYGKEWIRYLSDHQYNWPNYLEAPTKKIRDSFGYKASPYYVIINSKGETVGSYESFAEVMQKLNIVE